MSDTTLRNMTLPGQLRDRGGGGARNPTTDGGGYFFISQHRDPGLFPKDPGL